MNGSPSPVVGRPSWLWWATAVLAICVALASAVTAYVTQRSSDRPIGEGALFKADVDRADSELITRRGDEPDDVIVRRIRNALGVESVALVTEDGIIAASTSPNQTGEPLDNGYLGFLLSQARFGAVATPTRAPVLVDGIEEWPAGSVLYTVLEPIDGGAILLQYDVSELLSRRATASGIRTLTVQLAAVAAFFVLAAVAALIGRFRVASRHQAIRIESEFLRKHSHELVAANAELDAARKAAEDALELAEEKNRVRAEFVLMINHELRTPLTGVVTGAELLQSGALIDEADRDRLLTDMVADGNRLQEMIGQMLAVARIENRGLNFDLQEVSVGDLCEHIGAHHPRLVQKASDPSVLHAIVEADPMTLPQIISSLVDNAYQHGARSVALECTDELPFDPLLEVGDAPAKAVHFIVHDDGPGIDTAFLPRAFEKFEKDSRSSGTGLGLYLASVMIDAMDGAMSLTTSASGTSIAVSLPARLARRLERAG
jgi:signal transduction histidine kinase